MGENLTAFLPDNGDDVTPNFYTTSFLVPSSSVPKYSPFCGYEQGYTHQMFIHPENQQMFRQVINPSIFLLSAKMKNQFGRAMRILDVWPYFHLSLLNSLVTLPIRDKTLSKICGCARNDEPGDGCNCLHKGSRWDRAELLDEYLDARHKGLHPGELYVYSQANTLLQTWQDSRGHSSCYSLNLKQAVLVLTLLNGTGRDLEEVPQTCEKDRGYGAYLC
jgi:hypothetical protein